MSESEEWEFGDQEEDEEASRGAAEEVGGATNAPAWWDGVDRVDADVDAFISYPHAVLCEMPRARRGGFVRLLPQGVSSQVRGPQGEPSQWPS
jgi:hypothetical protein